MATHRSCHAGTPTDPEPIDQQSTALEENCWEVLLLTPQEETPQSEQVVISRPAPRKRKRSQKRLGVVIGKLSGRDETGQPLVAFPGLPGERGIPARTAVRWTEADLAMEVVLVFERGHPRRPVILGILQAPQLAPNPGPVEAFLDGERLVFTAEKEITLRCGKASLTLTQAGKVLIQGAFVSSRSSGVNRIKGGSVQIN